jgi:hypothetical protein
MNIKTETARNVTGGLASELNNGHPSVRSVVITALALWFSVVFFLGARGAFVSNPGSPPLAIFLGLAIPLALFVAAYFAWTPFRDFILSADLRFVAAMQSWRWAGQFFFWLYAWSVLPGVFAFPAGIGDMAIGVTAPWIVLSLVRDPSFAASRRYVTWNILGIVDFVVAVSMGVLSSGLFQGMNGVIGNVTSSAMNRLPLALVPACVVPFFTMLHLTALFQARRLAHSGKS